MDGFVLKLKKTKPFLVATWYRPPNSPLCVMDAFECVLDNLESQDIEINILEDLNCDVGATPADHHDYLKYVIIFNISSLLNNHHVPRITKNTATTIYRSIFD